MTIKMNKFGYVLTSRQAGKDAYAAFLPTLSEIADGEEVVVDFEGVNTFSPSWGDEFLTPLRERFGDSVRLINATNPSVSLTVEMLEGIHGYQLKTE
jgi:hypothetical protein